MQERILILGYGAVAHCFVPLLLKEFPIDPTRITIIDGKDLHESAPELHALGIAVEQMRLSVSNYAQILANHLQPGDICIDLTVEVDTLSLITWCYEHNVRYLNSSYETWPAPPSIEHPTALSLYHNRHTIAKLRASWQNNGPTIIIDHGANPGLISHFTKQALLDSALRLIETNSLDVPRAEIERALSEKHYAQLAALQRIQCVHISEQDTQQTSHVKNVDEFVSTWSPDALALEFISPVELILGTHERYTPASALFLDLHKRHALLKASPLVTHAQSWVPSGPFIGMIVPHPEVITIAETLSLYQNEQCIYNPSVYFVYLPCPDGLASLHEMFMHKMVVPDKRRILNTDITQGADQMGCLLMGPLIGAWWTGSALSIEQARVFAPEQNATTLQVAAGLVGAFHYLITYPQAGLRIPDELDHDFILRVARPYLGNYLSQPVDWNHLATANALRTDGTKPFTHADSWQLPVFMSMNRDISFELR